MTDSPRPKPKSPLVCDCAEWMRNACDEEFSYRTSEGKQYCVLHFPDKDKKGDFKKAFTKKLKKQDFNFRGVWFPGQLSFLEFDFDGDADFSFAIFTERPMFYGATFGALADFRSAKFDAGATFSNATFRSLALFRACTFSSEASFDHVSFDSRTSFGFATFSAKANFRASTFGSRAEFHDTRFCGPVDFDDGYFKAQADFRGATFNAQVDFSRGTFNAEANFSTAIFKDYVTLAGDGRKSLFESRSSLSLQFARIEKPELVSFHTIRLRPNWFVNVDARRLGFVNVSWDWRSIGEEVESIRDVRAPKKVNQPHGLLAIACRQLAVNAEENHRYEEASRFRYLAMEARRLENRSGFAFMRLSWWYWLASGYGERALQALCVLLGIWLLSALLYNHVGFARWEPRLVNESDVASAKRDDVGAPLRFSRALTYSAGVMTLQKPEPRPATTAAQTVVLLETILGPVQAALLALAIRRKFMR